MDNNVNNNLNNDVMQNNMELRTIKFDPMTGEPIVPVGPVEPTDSLTEQVVIEPIQEVNTEIPVQNTNTFNNLDINTYNRISS